MEISADVRKMVALYKCTFTLLDQLICVSFVSVYCINIETVVILNQCTLLV